MLWGLKEDIQSNEGILIKLVLVIYRFGRYSLCINMPVLRCVLYAIYKLADFLVVKTIAGAEIPAQATIGTGVRFEHAAKGVVIHPNAVIGKNARIFHQVTIGANDPRRANKCYSHSKMTKS